jgi:hypothetical protein
MPTSDGEEEATFGQGEATVGFPFGSGAEGHRRPQ